MLFKPEVIKHFLNLPSSFLIILETVLVAMKITSTTLKDTQVQKCTESRQVNKTSWKKTMTNVSPFGIARIHIAGLFNFSTTTFWTG